MKIKEIREHQELIKQGIAFLQEQRRNQEVLNENDIKNQGYLSMAIVRLEQAEELLASIKKYRRSNNEKSVKGSGGTSEGER